MEGRLKSLRRAFNNQSEGSNPTGPKFKPTPAPMSTFLTDEIFNRKHPRIGCHPIGSVPNLKKIRSRNKSISNPDSNWMAFRATWRNEAEIEGEINGSVHRGIDPDAPPLSPESHPALAPAFPTSPPCQSDIKSIPEYLTEVMITIKNELMMMMMMMMTIQTGGTNE